MKVTSTIKFFPYFPRNSQDELWNEASRQFLKKEKKEKEKRDAPAHEACTRSRNRGICIECNNLSNGWETRATRSMYLD